MAERLNLLGVLVSAFDFESAVHEMAKAIGGGKRCYACTCPVYTLMQGHERNDVRAALNRSDWVTADGMPVVWALRLLGSRRVNRVYGPDLMLALSELSAKLGYPQFYVGGEPGVAEDLSRFMQIRFPGLLVAGTMSPPFRELTAEEEKDMISELNGSGARIIWVGLGSPKQDLWMSRYRDRLKCELLVGVGAAFDFFTGRQRQAPGWMQRSGLEWLYRLSREPSRMWRRYVVYNPRFLWKLALQLTRLSRYEQQSE